MKMYWGRGITPCILDLSTRWRLVVSFTPQQLYPRERAPSTHWIVALWSPEMVWTWIREKFPAPAKTQTPDHPGCLVNSKKLFKILVVKIIIGNYIRIYVIVTLYWLAHQWRSCCSKWQSHQQFQTEQGESRRCTRACYFLGYHRPPTEEGLSVCHFKCLLQSVLFGN
jgi:hypothetical protein